MSLMKKEMCEFGPFSVDPAECVISLGGPLSLTPKVLTLLRLLRK